MNYPAMSEPVNDPADKVADVDAICAKGSDMFRLQVWFARTSMINPGKVFCQVTTLVDGKDTPGPGWSAQFVWVNRGDVENIHAGDHVTFQATQDEWTFPLNLGTCTELRRFALLQ